MIIIFKKNVTWLTIFYFFLPLNGYSQNMSHRTSFKLIQNNFQKRSYIKEFCTDSLLVSTKVGERNNYISLSIPVSKVASITVSSKVKHGRGALQGALWGLLLGAAMGTEIGNLADENDFIITSIPAGIAYTSALTIPVSALIGLVIGSRKKYIYPINGDPTKYRSYLEEIRKQLNK